MCLPTLLKKKGHMLKNNFPKQTYDKRTEETNVERQGIPMCKRWAW